MDFITIVGLIAASFTTIALLPQLIKVCKTKSTKDISTGMFTLFSVGVFLWFVYGVYLNDIPIILANFLAFIQALIILIFKIKYKWNLPVKEKPLLRSAIELIHWIAVRSTVDITFIVELIHLKKAFSVARNATVSSASTVSIRNELSFSNFTLARLVANVLVSGFRALRSVVSCLSDSNFKRIVAFALIDICTSMFKQEVQSNKQNLSLLLIMLFSVFFVWVMRVRLWLLLLAFYALFVAT
jgi:MtN3 and saliva related transmembrane protein